MSMPYKVVLLPFPVTPICVFGYYLFLRLGLVAEDAGVRFNDRSKSEGSHDLSLGDGYILNLAFSNLRNELEGLIPSFLTKDHWLLERYLSFCWDGDRRKSGERRLQRWVALSVFRDLHDPKSTLNSMAHQFSEWFDKRLDPWKVRLIEDQVLDEVPTLELLHPNDTRYVSLPIFKKTVVDASQTTADWIRKEIIDSTTIELHEGAAWNLMNAHLVVVIGGPPNSGKSTFTASLTDEISCLAKSLKTRQGWQDFSLKVECVNTDLATPTVDAIRLGGGKRQENLACLKRPWSIGLAHEAAERLAQAKARSNIVFADLPGGKIDTITEVLGAHADAAIGITRDWELIADWKSYFKYMGLPIITQARSRLDDDGLPSLVMTYKKNEFISGRVVGLNRALRSWDPFVSWTAEFLLFDILPSLVTRRHEALRRIFAK